MSEFGKKCIAQVSLLGIQLIWTTDFQDALTRMSKDGQQKLKSGTHYEAETMQKRIRVEKVKVDTCILYR